MVSCAGAFLIPLAAYSALRDLKFNYPIPITGALFMIPFLFNEGNTIWGGNIASALSGEFAYQIGLSLFIYFLGSLYRGVENGKGIIKNVVLLSTIGLTHGYPFLAACMTAPFFVISSRKKEIAKRFAYLCRVYAIGIALMGVWLLPAIMNRTYTIPYRDRWSFTIQEVFPRILAVFPVFSLAALILKPDKRIAYLVYAVIAGLMLFFAAYPIGVIDIRFVSFIQVAILLLSSCGIWAVLNFMRKSPHIVLALAALTFLWTSYNTRFTANWIDWNYSGFEAKAAWRQFSEINGYLKGSLSDPRVVFEPSTEYEKFGTMRAFESLPLFAGRQTLEGLYMESSISSPFVFCQQAEMSQHPPCPYPDYHYPRFNLHDAIAHLRLFNVRDIIIASEKAKAEFKRSSEVVFKKAFGGVEIYEVIGNDGRFAVPVRYRPVIYKGADWKRASYDWFNKAGLLDVPIIFNAAAQDRQRDLKGLDEISSLNGVKKIRLEAAPQIDVKEILKDEEILIHTSHTGWPLLIKVSYHPNWRVEGADKIFFVSPSFMMVYPKKTAIRLHYGRRWPDYVGLILTLTALAALINVRRWLPKYT